MNRAQPKSTAGTPEMLRLDNQLCFAVYSTMLSLNKLYRKLLEELDLTYPQYLVMLVLWEKDEQIVSEIGEKLFLDSATLTPLLKRLEKQGLVSRRRAREDERQVVVSLTPEGHALKSRAASVPSCVGAAMECNPTALSDLRTQLTRLRGAILKNSP